MSEAHDDHQDRLEAARLRVLIIGETGVRVLELAVLFSAFEDVAQGVSFLEEGNVPYEELPGVPDPGELLAKEDDMTTREAVDVLRGFLDMSAEGEGRLWRLLSLVDE